MALKITNTVQTDKGSTNELYIMFSEVYVNKQLSTQLPVKTYLSKEARVADINDTCKTFVIKPVFTPSIPVEVGLGVTLENLYSYVKAELEEEGFTVENI